MEESEQIRQQVAEDEDEEVARYLLLKNTEFVHELQHNQVFLSQLEMKQ